MAIGLRTPILNRSISLCVANVQTLAYFCNSFFRVGGIAANEKVLWLVGDLKLVRPNVRRYKLLIFNYLQMFGSFRLPITKVQKNYQSSITSVRPHLPQYYVGGRCFSLSSVRISLFSSSSHEIIVSMSAVI